MGGWTRIIPKHQSPSNQTFFARKAEMAGRKAAESHIIFAHSILKTHQIRMNRFSSILLLFCIVIHPVAYGQSDDPSASQVSDQTLKDTYGKKFQLRAGGYWPKLSTAIRVDSELGKGTLLDFEDDLGMEDNKALIELMFNWQFGKKWYFQADYIDLNRISTGTFDRKIVWGDPPVEYQIGSQFAAKFDVMIARMAFGYDIIRKERHNLALTVGAHWTRVEAGVAARLSNDDKVVFEDSALVDSGGPYPLPNFGLAYQYAIGSDWLLDARIDVFFLKIDEWAGQLYSGELNVMRVFGDNKNWTVGTGYKFLSIDVEYERKNFTGLFEFQYQGPKFFVSYAWGD